MNKSTITLATLSIIGAGALGYWQISKSPESSQVSKGHNQEQATEAGMNQALPSTSSATRSSSSSSSTKAKRKVSIIDKITDTSIRWELRRDILLRMDADSLTADEIDSLYDLLTHSPQPGQEENWWVVVNEIMEQLRKQGIGKDRYTSSMLSIIRDIDAPEVLRDYAVQHLSQWVTPRAGIIETPSESDPQRVEEVATTLGAVITDTTLAHTSIPGTTLMALIDMKSGGVSDTTLSPVIDSLQPWFSSTIAGENDVNKITRISAINAVGMLQLQQHSAIVRQLAHSDDTDASIRLNSIAALGSIGSSDDLSVLKAIATSDTRYRHAAKSAINKLHPLNPISINSANH